MKTRTAALVAAAALLAALCGGEAQAATFKVATAPALRRALRAAAANRSADTIVLAGGINHATGTSTAGSISGSLFDGNRAADGGGAFVAGHFHLGGNTFARNVATARGGGASLNGYTTVRGNRFLANAADEGGGLWADWHGQTIESNVFAGNAARRGGGLAITPQRSSVLITDRYSSNILWGNATPGAGADLLLDSAGASLGTDSQEIQLQR